MKDNKIIKICGVVFLITIAIFIFYLIFVKPSITGSYVPTAKDCKKSYQCNCLKDNCLCTYQKWFKEQQVMCDKSILKDKQINK